MTPPNDPDQVKLRHDLEQFTAMFRTYGECFASFIKGATANGASRAEATAGAVAAIGAWVGGIITGNKK